MVDLPPLDERTQNKINQLSREEKCYLLQKLDPERFQEIHPNDTYRLDRSLGIALMGRRWHESGLPEGGLLKKLKINIFAYFLDIPREELYERINLRCKKMIHSGLLDETRILIEKYGEKCPALNSLGYNFAVENIQGKISLDSLKEKFSQSHRNYAKTQITWFKKEGILKSVSRQRALSDIKNIEI